MLELFSYKVHNTLSQLRKILFGILCMFELIILKSKQTKIQSATGQLLDNS